MGTIVESDRLAEDVRIRAETPSPKPVAQKYFGGATGTIFHIGEQTSSGRRYIEQAEVAGRHTLSL
jgi:hypothetical protein